MHGCPEGSVISAQQDAGEADGEPRCHGSERLFRVLSGKVEIVVLSGPVRVGGHILQQFLNHAGLEPPVPSGFFQRGEVGPQIEDGILLHVLGSRDGERTASGVSQLPVIAFHQRRIGELAFQPGHALEDGVRPEPPPVRPGGSIRRLVPFDAVLPLDGVGGESLRHEGNIESFVHSIFSFT